MLQIDRFMDEAEALHALLSPLTADDFLAETGFKNWTVNDVLRHLYVWNQGAELSAKAGKELDSFLKQAIPFVMDHNIREFERLWAPDCLGEELLQLWWQSCQSLKAVFSNIDPKARLKWAGPDLSARSSMTARLMETWAHGQALYDLRGIKCPMNKGLQDIADLGVRTFGWTFKNRKLPLPDVEPYISLWGPDGEIWEWGNKASSETVRGQAYEFCQVVTQARNIEDTSLDVKGEVALEWMKWAQCFAGPPETPPEKGMRG